jgi:hypothetical protein
MIEEFKLRIQMTKAIEKQRHLKEDMEVLYSQVETECDEVKRVSAWEKLKAIRAKAIRHAVKHGLFYSDPAGMCL